MRAKGDDDITPSVYVRVLYAHAKREVVTTCVYVRVRTCQASRRSDENLKTASRKIVPRILWRIEANGYFLIFLILNEPDSSVVSLILRL
jgi:hypothetical protein